MSVGMGRRAATAFAPAVDGVAQAASVVTGSGVANGTATWARAFKSDGTTAVYDGSVGLSSANIVLNSVTIVTSAIVSLTSVSYTQQRS